MKPLCLCLLLVMTSGARLFAQTMSGGDTSSPLSGIAASAPAASPSAAHKKNPGAPETSGSTTIDSFAMDYDEKTRIAIFTGDNYGVFVKNPQFTVNCNKVTAYLRKTGSTPVPGAKGKASPTPKPPSSHAHGANPAASPGPDAAKTGSLQRAIAEGGPDEPVVIVQDKPGVNGQPPQHSVGIAEKADYNADTGEIKLTGWPQVTQGSDKQIATSRNTVMIMNKDGGTMRSYGPTHSEFVEQAPPKTTGSDAAASPSPSSSPQ